MEEMLKLQTSYGSNNRSQSTNSSVLAAMHQNSSHVISSSEFKPNIKIVHIFAPEIIKTDVANFRELVQRLTGKPTDGIGRGKKRGRSSTTISSSDESSKEEMNLCKKLASTKTTVELCNGFRGSSYVVDHHHRQQRIKDEEEEEEEEEEDNLWRDGLGDIDGFIQGLTHEYPFLPLMTSSSNSHLDAVFGADTYLNLAN